MRKYYQIDAKEKILGRLATEIARVLSGKGKVNYTPTSCPIAKVKLESLS